MFPIWNLRVTSVLTVRYDAVGKKSKTCFVYELMSEAKQHTYRHSAN